MTISASIQRVMDSALEGIKSDLRSNLQNALPSAEQAARTIISNRFSAPRHTTGESNRRIRIKLARRHNRRIIRQRGRDIHNTLSDKYARTHSKS